MAQFVAILIQALGAAMGYLVGRVLIALGVSVVTFFGVGELLDVVYNAIDQVWVQAGTVPGAAEFVAFLGLLQVDVCIDILIAAYAGRLTFMGMAVGGGISRLVNRFPVGG